MNIDLGWICSKIKSIYSNGGYEWIITERKFKCENGVIIHHTHKK